MYNAQKKETRPNVTLSLPPMQLALAFGSEDPLQHPQQKLLQTIRVSASSLDLVIWKGLPHHRKHLNSCFPATEHLQKGFSLLPCLREGFKWPCEPHAAFPCQWPPGSNHRHVLSVLGGAFVIAPHQPWLCLSAAALSLMTDASPPSSSCALWSEWDCVLSAK